MRNVGKTRQIRASLRPVQDKIGDFSTYCSKLMYLTTVVLESSTQMPQMSVEVRTKSTKVSWGHRHGIEDSLEGGERKAAERQL